MTQQSNKNNQPELKEHDMVTLNESGAKGAVVYVYEGRGMYEVEFPREGQQPIIMTLAKNEIQKTVI